MKFLLLIFLSSCSSLLYYPTQVMHSEPIQNGFKVEDHWIPGSNPAHPLHAWYFKNKEGRVPKARILFFHGNAESLSSHFAFLSFVVDHGYDFLIFDYQGYGKTQGAPSPKNTVLDGIKALEYLSELNKEKVPLVIFAQSLGGCVAQRVLLETQDKFKISLLILDSTFYSYKKVGQKVLSNQYITWPFQWLSWILLSDDWAPTLDGVKKIRVPTIVTHGTADRAVAFDLGKTIYENLEVPKDFWVLEGAQHTQAFYDKKYQDLLIDKLNQTIESAK